MFRIQTSFTTSQAALRPLLSLSEAVRRAQLYALTGVPIEVQGDMRLAQALIYAKQHRLRRPPHEKVQAAFAAATSISMKPVLDHEDNF